MATTGYELVKESIFKEANEVSERLKTLLNTKV